MKGKVLYLSFTVTPMIQILEAPVTFTSAAAAKEYGCAPTHHVVDVQFPADNGAFPPEDYTAGALMAIYDAELPPRLTNAHGDMETIFAFGNSKEEARANFRKIRWELTPEELARGNAAVARLEKETQ